MSASEHHHEHDHDDRADRGRKGTVGVKVVHRPGSFAQQAYLPAIAEGLGVTFRHFMKNFTGNVASMFVKSARQKTDIATIEYPEEKKRYPDRHRGLHRLMLRDDGQVRCVACMMCPTVCPAHCITIVPEEAPDGRIEKRPKVFEIDELRCVVCGLCAEACPCDAIRMDTGMHAVPYDSRDQFIYARDLLLSIPSRDGTFETKNPRHEPGDETHPGLSREHGH